MGEFIAYRPSARPLSGPAVPSSPERPDVTIEGDRDGTFDGRSVTVVQGASITGELGGDTIEIYGLVRGYVRGGAVRVRATGRIEGEVEYGTLKVDPGAIINARCVPC
ncbi:bactofilin family protein [Shumkonia mesophila]|uniref:bactofilin family protein n=1 Tax=Shumkonia mesophila TaxID=2838854 RepID=UPI002934FD6C|nr:polymer-forming cytoskeletal protein [Shumkonia mesophila]